MKRGLIFFFFLLLFSHCERITDTPLDITPVPGLHHDRSPNLQGIGNSPDSSREVERAKIARIKKHKTAHSRQKAKPTAWPNRTSDSLMITRLKYLHAKGIEPDLNEPVSRSYLFSHLGNPEFQSMITLSRESLIRFNFDNDILDYTDRFYTNGIRIDIISPVFQMNPLSRLMIPYWGPGKNYYGLSLVQNMYTPSTTKTGGILHGDRPYAAYLYAGSFKITNDPAHTFRQTSELDAGIIGPNSYGEWVQRSFHNSVPTNNEPLGWEYQIQNDLVLNYSVTFEKGLFMHKNAELMVTSTGSAGTLYTNLTGGAQFRTGWINPFFANPGVAKKKTLHDAGLRKFQFFFFVKGSGKLVGYDATLQGGLFNRTSSYTLEANEISRIVFQGSGGVAFSWNGIRLDAEQFMLSPEFQGGWWHKWVHVALTFCL